MDFRVELSAQAQIDISSIHDWLRSQSAGETGERWFAALRTAIATLKQVPSRKQILWIEIDDGNAGRDLRTDVL
jgi:plasmid stabilization system protein ParE